MSRSRHTQFRKMQQAGFNVGGLILGFWGVVAGLVGLALLMSGSILGLVILIVLGIVFIKKC